MIEKKAHIAYLAVDHKRLGIQNVALQPSHKGTRARFG
jgi:hypothetical protein